MSVSFLLCLQPCYRSVCSPTVRVVRACVNAVCAFVVQRAYHFGSRLLVEVDVVLPPETPLRESHDIGESLQIAIEKLHNVERVCSSVCVCVCVCVCVFVIVVSLAGQPAGVRALGLRVDASTGAQGDCGPVML